MSDRRVTAMTASCLLVRTLELSKGCNGGRGWQRRIRKGVFLTRHTEITAGAGARGGGSSCAQGQS